MSQDAMSNVCSNFWPDGYIMPGNVAISVDDVAAWAEAEKIATSHEIKTLLQEREILIADGGAAKGMTKKEVCNAFDGLHFNYTQWNNALGKNIPNWLKDCRVTPGRQGSNVSATWNPVLIATALFDKRIQIKKLDSVFVGLKDWQEEWQEASASFRD